MPIREYGCEPCMYIREVIHPAMDPTLVPIPICIYCYHDMALLISLPTMDTSGTFNKAGGGAFEYTGPTGLVHEIDTLHKLRQVEHAYQESGHDVRFDAWNANENNPDPVDGFGPEYHDGSKNATGKRIYSKW